jgi:cell division protein FtsQ
MARDTSRSDDAAFDMESAYRRRQRVVAVSRSSFAGRLRRLLRGIAKSVAVVLPAICALALVARYAFYSSRFALADTDAVVVAGNRYVSQLDVASAAGAGAEPNLFHLSLDGVRRQVELIPWVETASVRRIFPNRLLVDVTERRPVAYVNLAGRLKLVDSQGVLLEKPAEASFDFPVLTGIDAAMTTADRKARLALFQQFAQELKAQDRGAGWLVSEVDLSDDRDLKALLVQGHNTVSVHFGNQDFGERFRTFITLLPEVEKTAPSIDSVDLRYRGQVIVNPKAAP